MNAVVLLFCVIPMLNSGAGDRAPGAPPRSILIANAGAALTAPTSPIPQQSPGWDLLPTSCQGEDSDHGEFVDVQQELLIPASDNSLRLNRTGSAAITVWISCHSIPLRC